MFEYIKGVIEYVSPEYIVVDHQGIGYQIMMPNPFVFSKELGREKKVYIHMHVREDLLALYGFESAEEKKLFQKLLNVSGIGPKGALAILASGAPQQVIAAIENEDEKFLTKFPGVGKKTARQMILDLKGKLQDVVPDYFPNLFSSSSPESPAEFSPEWEEAALALEALGYSRNEIQKAARVLKGKALSTDEYIKKALQVLLKI